MLEHTDEKLASLIEKMQQAGFDNAPQVIEGATRAIMWDGLVCLVAGTVLLLCGLFCARHVGAHIKKKSPTDNEDVVAVVTLVAGAVSLIFSIPMLLIGNPWMAVFDPSAAFSQQIFDKIM